MKFSDVSDVSLAAQFGCTRGSEGVHGSQDFKKYEERGSKRVQAKGAAIDAQPRIDKCVDTIRCHKCVHD